MIQPLLTTPLANPAAVTGKAESWLGPRVGKKRKSLAWGRTRRSATEAGGSVSVGTLPGPLFEEPRHVEMESRARLCPGEWHTGEGGRHAHPGAGGSAAGV